MRLLEKSGNKFSSDVAKFEPLNKKLKKWLNKMVYQKRKFADETGLLFLEQPRYTAGQKSSEIHEHFATKFFLLVMFLQKTHRWRLHTQKLVSWKNCPSYKPHFSNVIYCASLCRRQYFLTMKNLPLKALLILVNVLCNQLANKLIWW